MTHLLKTCINTTSIRNPFKCGSVRILQDSSYPLQTVLALINNSHRGNELLNLLTPNVNYSGRTAPLTSKVAFYILIQQI